MWVFTTDGFYSAVAHREDKTMLMVRCRKEADAKALAKRLTAVTDEPHVLATPEADYAWRLVVPRLAWSWYLWQFAADLDYPNFKNAVAERQGWERADIYHDVWQVMWEYQTDGHDA